MNRWNVDDVRAAWAAAAGTHSLARFQVVTEPGLWFCPPGWVGILSLAGTVTVAVPPSVPEGLVERLATLSPAEVVDPTVVARHVSVNDMLGPATLSYLLGSPRAVERTGVQVLHPADLDALLDDVSEADIRESGIRQVTSPLFASCVADEPIAVAGWEAWPQAIAHLCVLTISSGRQQGHGRRAAAAAIVAAGAKGLLVQWRAHPPASQALARSLGLTHLGVQLSLDLGESG